MVDRHGLKMVGLRKIAVDSKRLEWSGNSFQIVYDIETGECWYKEHVGNSYTVYDDDDIITAGYIRYPVTMQYVADMIADAIIK